MKMNNEKSVPSVSVTYAQNGASTKSNELGMRAMQDRGARGIAWHPDARQITLIAKRDGDSAPQLYTLDPTTDAEPLRLTEIATGVGSYQWRPDGRGIAFTALEPRDAADQAASEEVIAEPHGFI